MDHDGNNNHEGSSSSLPSPRPPCQVFTLQEVQSSKHFRFVIPSFRRLAMTEGLLHNEGHIFPAGILNQGSGPLFWKLSFGFAEVHLGHRDQPPSYPGQDEACLYLKLRPFLDLKKKSVNAKYRISTSYKDKEGKFVEHCRAGQLTWGFHGGHETFRFNVFGEQLPDEATWLEGIFASEMTLKKGLEGMSNEEDTLTVELSLEVMQTLTS